MAGERIGSKNERGISYAIRFFTKTSSKLKRIDRRDQSGVGVRDRRFSRCLVGVAIRSRQRGPLLSLILCLRMKEKLARISRLLAERDSSKAVRQLTLPKK
jgi:hypothetical protein